MRILMNDVLSPPTCEITIGDGVVCGRPTFGRLVEVVYGLGWWDACEGHYVDLINRFGRGVDIALTRG